MTTNNRELHVIFGAGPAGKATARALHRMGKQVRIINRRGHADDLPSAVEVVKGDGYDRAQTTDLTRGATAVYQASQPEYHEWPEKFPPLQASILAGAAANGARLVVIENLYPYGDTNGAPITETTPQNPHTVKGRVRKAMHDTLMAAHRAGELQVAIGRASNFIGPEYDLIGDMVMYPAIKGKKANGMGSLDQPHSFTYVPDFGEALAILGTRPEAPGQVWHVPSLTPITQRDLYTMMYEEAGQTPKMGGVGKGMMRMVGLFSPGARETVEMMYEWEKPFIVDNNKFTQAFGMTATPIREAVAATVAWFRAHPKTK